MSTKKAVAFCQQTEDDRLYRKQTANKVCKLLISKELRIYI